MYYIISYDITVHNVCVYIYIYTHIIHICLRVGGLPAAACPFLRMSSFVIMCMCSFASFYFNLGGATCLTLIV